MLAGLLAIVVVDADAPVTFTCSGLEPKGRQLVVRWTDGYKLPAAT